MDIIPTAGCYLYFICALPRLWFPLLSVFPEGPLFGVITNPPCASIRRCSFGFVDTTLLRCTLPSCIFVFLCSQICRVKMHHSGYAVTKHPHQMRVGFQSQREVLRPTRALEALESSGAPQSDSLSPRQHVQEKPVLKTPHCSHPGF